MLKITIISPLLLLFFHLQLAISSEVLNPGKHAHKLIATKGDIITFWNKKINILDYGKVTDIVDEGKVFFQVREFHDSGNYITFSIYSDDILNIGLPVTDAGTFKIGDTICSGKIKGEIGYLFTNNSAIIFVYDFLGLRLSIFETWIAINISNIEHCN